MVGWDCCCYCNHYYIDSFVLGFWVSNLYIFYQALLSSSSSAFLRPSIHSLTSPPCSSLLFAAVFYVVDQYGNKLSDEEVIDKIQRVGEGGV